MAHKATTSKKATSKKAATKKAVSKKAASKESAKKKATGKQKIESTGDKGKSTTKKAKKVSAKLRSPKPGPIGALCAETEFRDFIDLETFSAAGAGANERVLDGILGGHYGNDTNLDPPFDGGARSGLADRIQRAGVPVSDAKIISCTKVGCLRKEMNRANPGGR